MYAHVSLLFTVLAVISYDAESEAKIFGCYTDSEGFVSFQLFD